VTARRRFLLAAAAVPVAALAPRHAATVELRGVAWFAAPFIASRLSPGTRLTVVSRRGERLAALDGDIVGLLPADAPRGGSVAIARTERDDQGRLRIQVRVSAA
jgi:hypothetical protein